MTTTTSPSKDLERVRARRLPAGAAASELSFPDLMKRAEVLAKSGLVPKALQDNPAGIVLVGMRGAELGFSLGYSLENIDIIDNKAVPNAQARLTLLRMHGHEATFTESTAERATLRARRREYRNDPDRWVTFTYTIEDAKRDHLLDIWVEEWRIPPGGDRKKKMRYVVGNLLDGVDQERVRSAPAWAKKLIEAGPDALNRKDNYENSRISMLRAGSTRHMTRMEFSDVMAGFHLDEIAGDLVFDIDAELLDDPAESAAAGDDIEDADVVEPGGVDEPDEPPGDVTGITPSAEVPPAPVEVSWKDRAKAAAVPEGRVVRMAREIARDLGDTLPADVDDIGPTDSTLGARLLAWLDEQAQTASA